MSSSVLLVLGAPRDWRAPIPSMEKPHQLMLLFGQDLVAGRLRVEDQVQGIVVIRHLQQPELMRLIGVLVKPRGCATQVSSYRRPLASTSQGDEPGFVYWVLTVVVRRAGGGPQKQRLLPLHTMT